MLRAGDYLATSGRGVALYHKLLMEQMDVVERDGDFPDPASAHQCCDRRR
jgi:hypothetical protein